MPSDLNALHHARVLMDRMFGHVAPDSLYERPIPPRHRIVFYIGHVEAFDRNLFDLPSIDPALDRLFAFGIDPPPGELPSDRPEEWPSLDAVLEYRNRVRQMVDQSWNHLPVLRQNVAIEHRLMHAETFAYMLHGMEPSRLANPVIAEPEYVAPLRNELVEVPAGEACLGQANPEEFGWDNEFNAYSDSVPAFRIERYPVTNADWLRFVESGGPAPHFWHRGKDGWNLRTFFREISLPHDWPVYVTFQQAMAYVSWRGVDLPTEAQWHRAAYGDRPCRYPWGNSPPDKAHGNFDSRRYDPMSVAAHPESASPWGVEDLLGNGWEWTSSPFRPFPGFEPFPFYRGYSANFFDDDHYVLKGGSPRTDAAFLRRSFRNWFRSDYPYVYATFRCTQPLK